MVSVARKRIMVLIAIILLVYLLVRYLYFRNATLYKSQNDHKRAPGMPVLVTVFYEALCGDSKYFIIKQLLPAFKKAEPLMEIQLVPYGKAHTYPNPDGTYRFVCQHGEEECEGNMYHACAIEAIENAQERLNVIACMMRSNKNAKETMHECARQFGIENTDLIQKCFKSDHGAELLKLHGEATNALRPKMTFVPTITLDGSQNGQPAILKNLLGEVCKIFGDAEKAKQYCDS